MVRNSLKGPKGTSALCDGPKGTKGYGEVNVVHEGTLRTSAQRIRTFRTSAQLVLAVWSGFYFTEPITDTANSFDKTIIGLDFTAEISHMNVNRAISYSVFAIANAIK
jgi:hypothetical protein